MGEGKKRKGDHSPENSVKKKERTRANEKETELVVNENDLSDVIEPMESSQEVEHTLRDDNQDSATMNNDQIEELLSQINELATTLEKKKMESHMGKKITQALNNLSDVTKNMTNPNYKRSESTTTIKNKPAKKIDISETMFLPGETDNRFYIKIEFNGELKRTIHAFQIYNEIKKIARINLSSIFTLNKSSFVAQITSQNKLNKITEITSIGDKTCRISPYEPFNYKKGVIYVSGIEFDEEAIDEFKSWLQTKYPFIVKIELATFIRSKFEDTRAFLITFNTKSLPGSIYIPGLSGNTKVYPFVNRPMWCKKCLRYGHTEKKCRHDGETICSYCSEIGHNRFNCEAEVPKCYHCAENHPVGSRVCSRHIRECELVRIQDDRKVSFKRAIQIENGTEAINISDDKLPDVFTIHLSEENKRSLKPWAVEKFLDNYLGEPLEDFRSINSTTYIAKTKTNQQSERLIILKNINQISVEVRKGNHNTRPKGIIYINDYDMNNFEGYKSELLKILPVSDVMRASWIKSKNNRATPLLLVFNKQEIPSYLSIPGESALTKVYQYKNKPLLCNRCQNYGHSFKRCESPVVCGRCDTRGHSSDACESNILKCHHCSEQHASGFKECIEYKKELEIVALQQKQGCSRTQAKLTINRNNPSFNQTSFSEMLKRAPNADNNPNQVRDQHPSKPIIQINNNIINQPQPSTSSNTRKGTQKTNALLQSPNSGRIYEEQISIETANVPQTINGNNESIYEDDQQATYKIFTESKPSNSQQDANYDREQYEDQLKQAKKDRKIKPRKIRDRTESKERHRNHHSRSSNNR